MLLHDMLMMLLLSRNVKKRMGAIMGLTYHQKDTHLFSIFITHYVATQNIKLLIRELALSPFTFFAVINLK